MPEEILRLLLGGVGWGLGTLFAGQGDIARFPMNVNFANIQLILLVHIGDNRSTSCRLCSDKLDYHFRKSVLVKRWSILNTYTLNLKVP